MSQSTLCKWMKNGSAALVVAAVMAAGSLAMAANDKKPAGGSTTPKQEPAASHQGNPGGGASHGPTGGGAATHGPTTGGGASHGPTTGGAATHGPTTGGFGSHGPTTGGVTAHGPTTGGATTHGPTTGGFQTHGPTTGGVETHGPTTGGFSTHGPTTTPPNSGFGGGTHTTPGGNPGFNGGMHPGNGGGGNLPGNRTLIPRGVTSRTTARGNTVNVRADGRVRDVHDTRGGFDVHRNLNGNSRVFVERPDHSRVVFERGRPGYVQRPYSFHGHDFARRTYFYNGHEYSRFYRGWGFRGLYLNVYAPGFYFGPAFYGWAYNPWRRPIVYGWGWRSRPWYGYYGGYFEPYREYPSAAFWLTDYMISNDLEAAYQAHTEAGEMDGGQYAPGGPAGLTPDVKQQIAEEVRNQLALENQEAQMNARQQDVDPGSSGVARMLGDGRPHVFVVGNPLDLVDQNGQECGMSDGDVLGLQGPQAPDAVAANLVVLASKGGQECPKGDAVTVQLADLQGMQNHMRETIDQGLQELQTKQGSGGLPQAPAAPTTPAGYAPIAPPPDPNAAQEIQQEGQQGTQAEQDAAADVTH